MATLTFPIHRDGLICDAIVGLNGPMMAALTTAGMPIVPPVKCRALIDTGSDISAVDATILRALGLSQPATQTSIQASVGQATIDLYRVSLGVLDLRAQQGPKLVVPNVTVMELPSPLTVCEVLIGLDVLLTTRLILDGPAGFFSLDC